MGRIKMCGWLDSQFSPWEPFSSHQVTMLYFCDNIMNDPRFDEIVNRLPAKTMQEWGDLGFQLAST